MSEILLRKLPLLAEASADIVSRIEAVSEMVSFAAGKVVFTEGQVAGDCFIVAEGLCRAIREVNGQQVVLANFDRGDFFGELALFTAHPRLHTVEVVQDSVLLCVHSAGVRDLLVSDPLLAVEFLAHVSGRLFDSNERLARQSFQKVAARVAGVVAQLAKTEHDRDGSETVLPTVYATQAEVAMLAGTSRESASRFLAVLERQGVIEQGRGRITVRDSDLLDEYTL
jgi:CRP/FNR family cyclic AMP-dependent transcriptional regulator